MPDGFTTGCQAAVADAGGEDLEGGDGVRDVAEGGVETEGAAEAGPKVPGTIAPITVLNSDAGSGRRL